MRRQRYYPRSSLVALLLLIAKPDSGHQKPGLGTGGGLMFGLAIFLILVTATHVVLTGRRR